MSPDPPPPSARPHRAPLQPQSLYLCPSATSPDFPLPLGASGVTAAAQEPNQLPESFLQEALPPWGLGDL